MAVRTLTIDNKQGSQVLPFVFEQISTDFQSLTIQGNLSYRIADPKKITSTLPL